MQKQLCWRKVVKAANKNLRSSYIFTCNVTEQLLQVSALEMVLGNNRAQCGLEHKCRATSDY